MNMITNAIATHSWRQRSL